MSEEQEKIGIEEVNLEKQMKSSYLNYSMSVITSRALPDVRDGLKPVHRRILYAMDELGVYSDKPHRKSSKISGDVMGNYHPHGDAAIYDAMVRLAQDFNIRYPLVDGHGNFGSIDGYGAAAPRYTEARMSNPAMELLRDIHKDTVDFKPNYDGERTEPTVLPSRFPNLLVNGSAGIAVGMATNMAPHNIAEAINATVLLIKNPEASLDELLKLIPGPDFPTGGLIMGTSGIEEAYRSGRGKIIIRAKADIEETNKGKYVIVVTEIPYQVNKTKLIQKIADLVKEKKIEGITGVHDESDRNGMRIVVELRRDAVPNVVLNQLYKYSPLESTFGIINLALVNGEPKVLGLRELLTEYIKFQREVVIRRTKFELDKAEARDHILQGLLIAIENADEVIRIVRSAYDDAKEKLIETFSVSEIQSQAILDMRLRRLQKLEKDKLEEEHQELLKTISRLKDILGSSEILDNLIISELEEISQKFGDKRRTDIIREVSEIEIEDLIEEDTMVITLTHYGYIKRTSESEYRTQNRGGHGMSGLTTREEDFVEDIYMTGTHDFILFFTSLGNVFSKRAFEIPEGGRTAKGTAAVNLLELSEGEKIRSIVAVPKGSGSEFIVFATKNGIIKKTEISQFSNIRKSGIRAITLKDDDEISCVRKVGEGDFIILVSRNGQAVKFCEKDISALGRTAMGVIGMRLDNTDMIIGMEAFKDNSDILTVSERGYGKRSLLSDFPLHKRGGKGVRANVINKKTGNLVGVKIVEENDDILLITDQGQMIRIRAKDITRQNRATAGLILMKLKNDQSVVAVAKVVEDNDGV